MSGIADPSTETYCDDPTEIASHERGAIDPWQSEAAQHLHRLWLDLCAQYRNGELTYDAAFKRFEDERSELIRRIRERDQEHRPARPPEGATSG